MGNVEKNMSAGCFGILQAIRRNKDNPDLEHAVVKEVEKDSSSIDLLKSKIKNRRGIWRIYRTINNRSLSVAQNLLIIKLLQCPEDYSHRIDSLWIKCLLQPECKIEKNFLIDIDIPNLSMSDVIKLCNKYELIGGYIEYIKTPNGFHVVTNKVDSRLLEGVKNISVQRDGYKFVEIVRR